MKKYWSEIFLYGLSLGLLLAAMQFFKFRLVVLKNATEWYAAVVAVLFAALGIWVGRKWQHRGKQLPSQPENASSPAKPVQNPGLTARELEILTLMAAGHSNQEIADQLFLSLNTVKTQISNLLSKLDVQRRTQAIQKARSLGLL